ncbi:MAG: hypothetical protein IKE75_02985 [Bacilli bacterium]|nr:hypothetical protein [Bacilli bacterium]
MHKKGLMKICVFIVAFFSLFFVGFADASAVTGAGIADQDSGKKPHYCVICSGDEKTYLMEKQFGERIKIIKSILGDAVDEIALAATVLHKEDALEAVKNRYDENFNSSNYRKDMEVLFDGHESNRDEATSSETISLAAGVSGEQIDLLNAAAIVMAASSGWTGKYNEAKYQEALASDGLITENPVANLLFCEIGRRADHIFTIGNVMYHFASGQDVEAEINRTSTRWNNMEKICNNGYIGGVYNLTPETKPDEEIRKLQREEIAEEIINLIHYYKLLVDKQEENNCDAPTSTGPFASWKQSGASWSNISVGGGGSIANIGCLVTSVAIQIARSGTKLTNITDFNPGTFVTTLNSNGGFAGGGNYTWTGHQKIAPNWKVGPSYSTSISSTSALANVLSKELSSGAEGKYQKFIVLQIHHSWSPQHWVAVDSVSGNQVTIFDPGSNGNTLDDNYQGWVVDSYRVMYATDVLFGKTGSSNSSSQSGSLDYNSSTYKERLNGLSDYLQCGPKLVNVPLGKSTVCVSGCIVSSVAAINYMFTGQHTDVTKLIADMIKEGEFSDSRAGMATPYFDNPSNSPIMTDNWGLSGESLYSDDKNKIKDNVINSLKDGKKVLLNLGGAKTTYSTVGGHFLMIDHYDTSSNKMYIFNPSGTGIGYITEQQLMDEVLAYNKNRGPWAISSKNASGNDPCDTGNTGDVVHQTMEFIRNGEGMGMCNYHGKGENTGYQAYVITADMVYVGWSTGYGFTQLYMKDYADRVGYTTYIQDGNNGCTDKEYIDKMAELKFGENYELVKKLYSDASGGKELKDHQYVALIYKYNHWPAIISTLIDEISKVDPYSYEAFSIFMKYNGLGGSCGGYNGSELIYHVWYNGNYKAVRDYPCAQFSRDYWARRVQLYKSEEV